jgi:hypothetical protein
LHKEILYEKGESSEEQLRWEHVKKWESSERETS